MVLRRLAAASLLLISLPGIAVAQSASAKRGEVLLNTNCAECHATGVKGDSPNPKAPPFRTLGQRYKLDDLQEALAEGIVVGHGGAEMPHFIFEPTEIDDIIVYLKRINRKQ